jgi:hypothetical protein
MKRCFVLFALVMTVMLALTGTASASTSLLNLDSRAILSDTKTSGIATGSIVCTAGNEVSISVVLLQSSGKVDTAAQGFQTLTCTGAVQTFAVTTDVVLGNPLLKKGPATTIFSASDSTDGTSFPTQVQGVKIG